VETVVDIGGLVGTIGGDEEMLEDKGDEDEIGDVGGELKVEVGGTFVFEVVV